MVNPIPNPHKIEALDTLLEKADVQGYLTTGDILEVFPWDGERRLCGYADDIAQSQT